MTDTPRVLIFPADNTACGHYRLTWPAEVLMTHGWEITVVMPSERGSRLQVSYDTDENGVRTPTEVFFPSGYDVIVLQRVSNEMLAKSVPLIRAKGVAVVVDIDDDLSNLHPSNPAFDTFHPTWTNPEHSWRNTLRACEAATLVQVSTPALVQRYGRKGNARVVRNCVPQRYLDIPHEDNDVVVWPASLHSHMNDADALGASISRLMHDGYAYGHMGDNVHRVKKVLSLPDVPIDYGNPDLGDWPFQLARVGIGIAPLADTTFNRAKSWLKPLELASLGVPVVMSPRDEYRLIHQRGVGVLAKNPGDWYKKVRALIENADYRQAMSQTGREEVANFTYEKQAWRWGEVWKEAASLI